MIKNIFTSSPLRCRLAVSMAVLSSLLLLASCETDSYDKGTGELSLMQADFADITVNSQKQAVCFQTDEGDSYTFVQPVATRWIETPDTTYRAIVYYNKVNTTEAEAVALGTVPTLKPREHWKLQQQPQDPVGFESAWVSSTGRYVNLGLLLKSGRVDDEEGVHTIGLAQDTVLVHANQRRTAYYRFLHDQGDVPQYYTNRRYVSIFIPADRPDTIHLTIQTYEGPIERQFALQ